MKNFKLVAILILIIISQNSAFAQNKPGQMQSHFGYMSKGMNRIEISSLPWEIKNKDSKESMTYKPTQPGLVEQVYMSGNFFGILNEEMQNGLGLSFQYDGPNGTKSLAWNYGQTAKCHLLHQIIPGGVCGIWTLGPEVRFRKLATPMNDKYESTDLGVRSSYSGANKNWALQGNLSFFNKGTADYRFAIYNRPIKSLLIGLGVKNENPFVSIGSICTFARCSIDGMYDNHTRSYKIGGSLILSL